MALNDLVLSLRPTLEPLAASEAASRWQEVREGHPSRTDSLRASPFAREAAFHALREAREGASDRAGPRLRRLQELSTRALLERLGAESWDARLKLEREGRLEAGLGGHSLPVARWMLERDPDRGRRETLERGLADREGAHATPALRLLEASFRTAELLGVGDPVNLRDQVTGLSHRDWVEAGGRFEAATREGYLDLLRFALDRTGPRVRPLPRGEAATHDVLYAARAPWLTSLLPREALLPALQRWTEEFFEGWTAGGRVRILLDEGPSHASPAAVALMPPTDIRLAVRREAGLCGWRRLLGATGHAQALSMLDPHAPPEDRRLADGAVRHLPSLLMESLLFEPRWLMRYARVTSSQARELVRFAAFEALTRTRRQVAELELGCFALTGPSPDQLERFWSERTALALAARTPPSRVFRLLDPNLPNVHLLRGWGLVGQLHPMLLASFDEDWWRNPSAGHFLRGLFSRGGRDDAELLAVEWGATGLTLDGWQERLLRCMSA